MSWYRGARPLAATATFAVMQSRRSGTASIPRRDWAGHLGAFRLPAAVPHTNIVHARRVRISELRRATVVGTT